jgi:hypothetical protein
MASIDQAVYLRDMRGIVLTVQTTREFRIRFWIALNLIRLAGWIARCETKIDREGCE